MMLKKRINTSINWRVLNNNSRFVMQFDSPANMRKAFNAMEAAIESTDRSFHSDTLTEIWIQDLSDCCDEDRFDIDSALSPDAFHAYIPAMCKAVAGALPEISFKGFAYYDDLERYFVQRFEFNYSDHTLTIDSEFTDDDVGYFCPHCGSMIGFAKEKFSIDEIECESCGRIVSVSTLSYRPPATQRSVIIIE